MKIYTRTGDNGSTGIFGGPRVSKDDPRIEACGSVDELNAAIGVALSAEVPASVSSQLGQIQHELFLLGAELATPNPEVLGLRLIDAANIEQLERWIDEHESGLPPLKQFILPSGLLAASELHMARAICRRAERRVVTMTLGSDRGVSEAVIAYLNRLSDLLFVQSRVVNREAGVREVEWIQPA